ncbi:hypothetical protein Sjap_001163 [Stephania japonica]|uniref:Uncharacterized protein n=1 Tax=Stephania japonica TaxID=461633 RepID=A0AAP0PR77_9MAGN
MVRITIPEWPHVSAERKEELWKLVKLRFEGLIEEQMENTLQHIGNLWKSTKQLSKFMWQEMQDISLVVYKQVIREGEIETDDPMHFVDGIPIGGGAYLVYVERVFEPNAFLWRNQNNWTTLDNALEKIILSVNEEKETVTPVIRICSSAAGDLPTRAGILFQDITTLLLDVKGFKDTIDCLLRGTRTKIYIAEVRSRGVDVTRADLWIEGHKNKNGRPHSDEIASVVEKINECQMRSSTSTSQSINKDSIAQMFGPEHQGRVRGLGFGVTPTSVRATTQSSILVRKLQGDFQRLEEKHEQLAELVRSQQMPPSSRQQQYNPPNLCGKKSICSSAAAAEHGFVDLEDIVGKASLRKSAAVNEEKEMVTPVIRICSSAAGDFPTTEVVGYEFSIREATILDIQTAFKQYKVTSRELVEFYIGEISRLNPVVHGVIEVNPDALRQADKADAERKAGDLVLLSLAWNPYFIERQYRNNGQSRHHCRLIRIAWLSCSSRCRCSGETKDGRSNYLGEGQPQ